jgi:hypothetical protein
MRAQGHHPFCLGKTLFAKSCTWCKYHSRNARILEVSLGLGPASSIAASPSRPINGIKPMNTPIRLLLLAWLSIFCNSVIAADFKPIEFPTFKEIEPRMVYGKIIYDFSFVGKGPQSRGVSAQDFLKSAIGSRFNNKEGSYIVTLDVLLNDVRIASEPILTATWKSEKFLFVTTSEKTNLVVNNNGVILDGVVIDNENNQMRFALSIYRSDNSTFDMSLFKQLSDLSKNSFVAKMSPGLQVANDLYLPFAQIFGTLLSKYEEAKLVETTVGAFTLLDEGFGNVLHYSDSRFGLNVYLKTENSQLNGKFVGGKFQAPNYELVLATVKSGVGAARSPVLQILAAGGAGIDENLTNFVRAVIGGTPYKGGYTESVAGLCKAGKAKLNQITNTRDASLVYWAFLANYSEELRKYVDGQSCANDTLLTSLKEVGLDFDISKLKHP